jgi:hypothetical protein
MYNVDVAYRNVRGDLLASMGDMGDSASTACVPNDSKHTEEAARPSRSDDITAIRGNTICAEGIHATWPRTKAMRTGMWTNCSPLTGSTRVATLTFPVVGVQPVRCLVDWVWRGETRPCEQ